MTGTPLARGRGDRFALLDSVRALAALSIVFAHTVVTAGASSAGAVVSRGVATIGADNPLTPYLSHRNVGVTIFFVLSGFLLYRPFVVAHADGRPGPDTLAYAWRRMLRIVPAYWFALLVTAVVLSLAYVFSVRGMATYFGFLQIYQPDSYAGGISVAWSLCIEVSFYAFIPLFAWAVRRSRGPWLRAQATALLLIAAASMAYKLALLTGDGGQHPLAVKFLPAYLDQFALGMGLAVFTVWLAARTGPAPLLVRVVDRAPGLAWLVAFAAYLSLAHIGLPLSGGPGHSTGVFLLRHAIFGVVGLAVLLPAVIGDPSHGFVRRLLANPVLLYLGLVSYAIYLWHPTVILLFVRHGVIGGGPQLLLWPLGVLAVTVAAATFSYYAVERPALRLRPARGVPAPVPQEAAVEAPAPAG